MFTIETTTSLRTDVATSLFAETDAKFKKACGQLILLNNLIRSLQIRYDRAVASNNRIFRYSVRLRLVTIEGMRNAFHEYATHLADALDQLEDDLVMETGDSEESDLE